MLPANKNKGSLMPGRKIGDITVRRVEEVGGPSFTPEFLYPDWTPEHLEKHRHWLVPGCYHERTGRFLMGIQSWVVETKHHTILIDTGIGNQKSRSRPTWNMLDLPWLARLGEVGVTPEQVDYVLCTHLHVDHVGWNTRLEDGRWVPTFPNARYLFPKGDYEHWERENRTSPANDGSFNDSVLPIMAAGKAELFGDAHVIADAIQVVASPGHSPGHVCFKVESKGESALIAGDIMHHVMQVYEPDFSTSFCADRDLARVSRKRILAEYAGTPTLVMPCHFPAPYCGRVVSDGQNYRFVFAD
ncbi:MAG: MBL fold metallo-hydrolase [Alphaproteobacteria bacterium]|nr:MBL fold metallo-hydrolase [Alphaproteobacteria bacterium]